MLKALALVLLSFGLTRAAQASSSLETGSASAVPLDDRAEESIVIESNTQATLDDVKIGAGNFWDDEWEEGGQKKKGMTAGLWVFVRDDAAKNQTLRVHAGSTFTASKLAITVKAVEGKLVRLSVRRAP
jgi:hypothetical protein